MPFCTHPTHFTAAEFRIAVSGLKYAKGWKPASITLHNTGVPSLAQWMAMGATAQERWGGALNNYYRGLGWHAGPHVVCCPDYIWMLCDPEQDGVSVSCWNHETFAVEMVGNFETGGDEFGWGPGAKVRDNAVTVLATLCEKFGWDIARVLRFHRECARDRHACPGSRVSKADIVQRVDAVLEGWGEPRRAMVAAATPAAATPAIASTTDVQRALIALGYSCGPAGADGDEGPMTLAAVRAFRADHNLSPGGDDAAFRMVLAGAHADVAIGRLAGGAKPPASTGAAVRFNPA